MGRHTVKQVFKKRLSFIDSSLGDAAFTAPAEQAKQAPVGPEECLPAPALPDRVSGFLLSFSSILRSFSSRASAPPAMSKRIFGRQAVSSAFFFLIFVTRASSGRRIYNSGAVVLVRLTTFIRFIPSFAGWRGREGGGGGFSGPFPQIPLGNAERKSVGVGSDLDRSHPARALGK